MEGIMVPPYATNMAPNGKSIPYKKYRSVIAGFWQYSIHKFGSSLTKATKEFVTKDLNTSHIQSQPDSKAGSSRPSSDRNRLQEDASCDMIQETIDSIVANNMARDQRSWSSESNSSHSSILSFTSQRLPDDVSTCVTSRANSAESYTIPRPPTSGTIDIVFDEHTRWRGVHPFNVKVKNMARFQALIPHSYRYARHLQIEAAFIPPLHHPMGTPGKDFVLRKRGICAIPIVDPNISKVRLPSVEARTIFPPQQEVEHAEDQKPAVQRLDLTRLADEMPTQVDLPLPSSDSILVIKVNITIAITETQALNPEKQDASSSILQSDPSMLVGHCSACAGRMDHIGVSSDSVCIAEAHCLWIRGIGRRTRRRQA